VAPKGGLARRATYINQVRAEGDPVVIVDAGDVFGFSGLMARLKAESAVEGMNLIGYHALGYGESEFMFGVDGLEELMATASFAGISSNLVESATGQPYGSGLTVVEAGTVRVAVLSVLSPALVDGGRFSDGHGRFVDVTDPLAALSQRIPEASSQADLVVVLAHVGYDTAVEMAGNLTGVDIVIAAHGGLFTDGPLPAGETVVAASGPRGEFLGRLDIEFGPDGSITRISGQRVTLDATVEDDPDLADLYQRYLDRMETAIDDILASIPEENPPTGGAYVGQTACTGCHSAQAAQWETTSHASAFDVLQNVNQNYNVECFPCHTTGFGYLGGFRLETVTPEMIHVQCEGCHGAGADHSGAPAAGYGPVDEAICRVCHESTRFPGWDYGSALPSVMH
jgi:hypothetical protein